jgi:putative alpha-1,2-mannosidase
MSVSLRVYYVTLCHSVSTSVSESVFCLAATPHVTHHYYTVRTHSDPSLSGFWFYDKSFRFFGIRLTHQPSPWTGDYGPMRFMAQVMMND